ncbi:hypothetical protein ACFPYI_21270 [Halomarina salina]|uniref:Uncharacterized protein n=1 Tax=Halomarina salina TaxID=1872699 RepID=A0ABD5RTQ9_9EURY|nr:hypothetical protein [Halomarina salina]
MVSPCPDWTDRDGGFERDGVVVAVEPVGVYAGGGLSTTERVDTEDEADAYDVSLWTRTASGERSVTPVTFERALSAWEFAHLLTWYVEDQGFDATREALSTKGGWSPPAVITDEGAEAVFRKLLDDDAVSLDAVLDDDAS